MSDLQDPFTDGALLYTTNETDKIIAPSAYANRRHAWIHIFPEGKIHQHPDLTMRYFKWGVARLILEAEPCPDLVPIWIQGFDQIMHESREFPKPIPRPGKDASVTFGDRVDVEKVFGDLRKRWKDLRQKVVTKGGDRNGDPDELGILRDDELRTGREAARLREECTLRVRAEVLKLRTGAGMSTEDPKASLVETWRREGEELEGKMEDGSWVKDT